MSDATKPANSGDALSRALRDRLAALVAANGEAYVMRVTGLTSHTLARALSGLGIRRGTVAQIEVGFAALEGDK